MFFVYRLERWLKTQNVGSNILYHNCNIDNETIQFNSHLLSDYFRQTKLAINIKTANCYGCKPELELYGSNIILGHSTESWIWRVATLTSRHKVMVIKESFRWGYFLVQKWCSYLKDNKVTDTFESHCDVDFNGGRYIRFYFECFNFYKMWLSHHTVPTK